MKLEDLLSLTPEQLAERQELELRTHVVERLREVANLINQGNYEKALMRTAYSPAGDDHGCDNTYIEFDAGGDDIGQVLETLQRLREQQKIAESPKRKK